MNTSRTNVCPLPSLDQLAFERNAFVRFVGALNAVPAFAISRKPSGHIESAGRHRFLAFLAGMGAEIGGVAKYSVPQQQTIDYDLVTPPTPSAKARKSEEEKLREVPARPRSPERPPPVLLSLGCSWRLHLAATGRNPTGEAHPAIRKIEM